MTAGLTKGCNDPVLWGGPQSTPSVPDPSIADLASALCRVLPKDDVEEQDDENAEDHGE